MQHILFQNGEGSEYSSQSSRFTGISNRFFYQNFLQSGSYQSLLSRYADFFSVDFVEYIHQEGEYELVFELWETEEKWS